MFSKIWLRLRSLFRGRTVDRELDDEVRFHVEQQTEEFVRQGMPREGAEKMARRRFGNVTLHKEECRDARKLAWLEGMGQDLRQGARTLWHSPGFTVVSALTLALGIGGTSALFSVVDSALLHPLTAPEPERLVWLQEYSKGHNESGGNPARLADWQRARSFSAVGGFYGEGAIWASPQGLVQLQVLRTVGDFGGALGARLAEGRLFTAAEIRGEGQPVAILSGQTFRRRFHSDGRILNRTVRLGASAYQIIGVLADGLDYPEGSDVWVPAPREVQNTERKAGFLGVVARLAPGISRAQAQAEIDLLSGRLAKEYPETDRDRSASLTLLADHVSNDARKPLLVLCGAVGSVLLIGCLNIAGLLLARGLGRRREAAIRVSVGAGYGRLVRLFFAESLLLAAIGCVGGLLLAFIGIDVLKAFLPAEVPHLAAVSMNLRVVLCSIGLSLLAAVLFGALPAWQFAASAQSVALKDGSSASVGNRKNGLRSGLVIFEVCFSAALLVTAVLLSNSFVKLRSRAVGFNAAKAYTFKLELPWDTDAGVVNSIAFDTLDRFKAFPGTISCGLVDNLPLHGGSQSNLFQIRGKTLPAAIAEREFGYRTASQRFFAAAGIPVLAGSVFRDWRGGQGIREAVISERLAQLWFPGENPIGHEFARPDVRNELRWFRIVGVVGAVPLHATDTEQAAEVYVPWGATYWPLMNFVVRTERPQADVSRYVHEQIQKANGSELFSNVETLDERTADTRSGQRTAALLVGGFAFLAVGLAALGIFGLMAHETKQRTQEIGVRLALGAEPRNIAFDAVLRAVKLVALGLAVGLCVAWYASELVKSLLFGVAPHDAGSYAIASGAIMLAAILASLWPAVRAARIDPIRALRHD